MDQSNNLFDRANQVIPGGVNSPVRAFKGVGGSPVFFKQGNGAYLIDEDDKRYIDYVGSWGPLIFRSCSPCCTRCCKSNFRKRYEFWRANTT